MKLNKNDGILIIKCVFLEVLQIFEVVIFDEAVEIRQILDLKKRKHIQLA